MKKLITILALFSSALAVAGSLPDPRVTPGYADPRVTQDNIQQTICVPNYSLTVRPSSSYTHRVKMAQLVGPIYFSDQNPRLFDEDHLIPLGLGGHPTSISNLWPQRINVANGTVAKDKLEVKAIKLVCTGKVSLAEMQSAIAKDWMAAARKYGTMK